MNSNQVVALQLSQRGGYIRGSVRGDGAVFGPLSPEGSSTKKYKTLSEALAAFSENVQLPTVHVRVCVYGREMQLRPALRTELYRIGCVAIVNACRSRANNIDIEIEYRANQLRVSVCDDGQGIEPAEFRDDRGDHWRLRRMSDRAERIGARLRVFSRNAAGTEVELTMPTEQAVAPEFTMQSRHWLSRLVS
jgi:signal transduction histidine kinase